MPVQVLIPTALRRFSEGKAEVSVEGATVAEALEALFTSFPDLRSHLCDARGKVRTFVNVYVNDENIRHGSGPATALKDGDTVMIVPAIAGGTATLSREDYLRYSRHLIMPEVALDGQQRLKAARVLCVGAGGLGSPLSLYLAAAGVGTIGLVDFDKVDLTNLQRQILYSTSDVGRLKLDAAADRLRDLNPEIEIVRHATNLDSWNVLDLFRDYDIIADGTDNFPTRYLVNDACVLLKKPNVYASIFRFEGQVTVFDAQRGPCYRCLYADPPPPGLVPTCAEGGVLGVLPGILGSLQALEVLKLILGVGDPLIGRLVMFDALAFKSREVRVLKEPDCAVCGLSPTVTAPVDYQEFCQVRGAERHPDGHNVPTISVEDFHRRRQEGEKFHLLDVRERHEYQIVKIPGAELFPMDELQSRIHELDSTQAYVITCQKTARGITAYHLIRKAGFGRLQVLAGGVDAWAERIDPSLPRY